VEFWLLARRELPQYRAVASGRFLADVRKVVPRKAAEAEEFLRGAADVLPQLFEALAKKYRRMAARLQNEV
jgi:phytoene dehydrogenase-like protein